MRAEGLDQIWSVRRFCGAGNRSVPDVGSMGADGEVTRQGVVEAMDAVAA